MADATCTGGSSARSGRGSSGTPTMAMNPPTLRGLADDGEAIVPEGEDGRCYSLDESTGDRSAEAESRSEEPIVTREEDIQMESEFMHLNLRKQVSYRKAIAKSNLQHLAAQPSALAVGKSDLDREIRCTVDWSEGALYGEHIWFETSVSGESCYVGEQNCVARTSQKSAARKKCGACRIVVHTNCIEQLEKLANSEQLPEVEILHDQLMKDPSCRVRHFCYTLLDWI